MDDQATVNHLAQLAKPRLMDLLKLKVEHIHEATPAEPNATPAFNLLRNAEPYKGIERFIAEDKIIGYIVNPGVLPIAKAIALDIRGRRQLLTRRVASPTAANSVVAHMDGFGVRIMMFFDPLGEETQIVWECLYRVN